MIIKMKTLLAGPEGVWAVGSIHKVTAEQGRALVGGGFAELLEEGTPPVETETVQAPETTALPEATSKRNGERKSSRKGAL